MNFENPLDNSAQETPEQQEKRLAEGLIDSIFPEESQLREYISKTEAPAYRKEPGQLTEDEVARKRESFANDLKIDTAFGTFEEYCNRLGREISNLSPEERTAMLEGLGGSGRMTEIFNKVSDVENGEKRSDFNESDAAKVKGYSFKNIFLKGNFWAKIVENINRFDKAAKTEILPSLADDLEKLMNKGIMSKENDSQRFATAHDLRIALEKAGLIVESKRTFDEGIDRETYRVKKAETEKA